MCRHVFGIKIYVYAGLVVCMYRIMRVYACTGRMHICMHGRIHICIHDVAHLCTKGEMSCTYTYIYMNDAHVSSRINIHTYDLLISMLAFLNVEKVKCMVQKKMPIYTQTKKKPKDASIGHP